MYTFKFSNKKTDQRVQKCLYKCSNNYKITKVIREIYLRNDISCGIEKCKICEQQKKKKFLDGDKNIFILDIHSIIKYIDFLYDCDFDNILIPITIFEHIKIFNKLLYKKLNELCYETDGNVSNSKKRYSVFANKYCKFTYIDDGVEFNLREIQEIIKIVIWYKNHNNNINIIVISENEALKDYCMKNDTPCYSLFDYVKNMKKDNMKYRNNDSRSNDSNITAVSDSQNNNNGKKKGSCNLFSKDILKLYFEINISNEENEKEILEECSNILKYEKNSYNQKQLYEEHLNKQVMIQKLRNKEIVKGVFQIICIHKIATVKISEDEEIFIKNDKNMNRAIHGDIVAVEILDDSGFESDGEIDYFEELPDPDENEEETEELVKDNKKESLLVEQNNVNTCLILNDEVMPKQNINQTYENIKIKKKLYGKVVAIITRGRKEYGGVIKTYDSNSNNSSSNNITIGDKKLLFFKAFNNKIPCIIIKSTMEEELRNKRVIVVMDKWEIHSKYPLGRCLSVLGLCDDIETETKLIYNEYNINTNDFSDKAYMCLPPSDWVIPEVEYKNRKDYRDILTFSIDPPGCEDIDDALSVEIIYENTIESNNQSSNVINSGSSGSSSSMNSISSMSARDKIRVGVHIADVTYFVKQNSPLDYEAAQRCTTVYLINQRIEMLPKLLTSDLCSLVEKRDRLAFSCIFTFDYNFNILHVEVEKSIINSNKSFSYELAQKVIDDKNDTSPTAEALRILNRIAKHLKKKWFDEGAIELSSGGEVLFEFEEKNFEKFKHMKQYESYETNKLIEVFMLLANRSIGKIIYQNFKSACVLRRHPPPKYENLKELENYLKSINIKNFKYNTAKELSESLNSIKLTNNNKVLSNILKALVTKCMNEALCIAGYNIQNNEMLRHYGLAADIYTFFTSPIRRYADIMVHRVLNHIYGVEKLETKYID
uniref:RNB domain-containing protein n=1 Tax=Piliocolobus tephrosceles TaxID=591936 RepID=A0A8C9GMR0_9PRIM